MIPGDGVIHADRPGRRSRSSAALARSLSGCPRLALADEATFRNGAARRPRERENVRSTIEGRARWTFRNLDRVRGDRNNRQRGPRAARYSRPGGSQRVGAGVHGAPGPGRWAAGRRPSDATLSPTSLGARR